MEDQRSKLINKIPLGTSKAKAFGRTYSISRSDFNSGKSIKVYAEELGGTDFISFNYYITDNTALLKPCEMPQDKVMSFLREFELITPGS
ncbi:peptide methionine sulfoxide reductase [Pseudomonas sp.]|uniref:peptide methionine sulfoxide reductase n=1 Tax=Pseudomonas sp. TaxID=306 RepID=UPI003A97C936